MSHSSKIFEEAPIKVQNRNGFDLSHLNIGSAYCGTLTPVLSKLLPPNSDFSLGVNMEVNLPPLAAPFYGRVDAIIEGFVVPCSILYGGWKQFITNNPLTSRTSLQSGLTYKLPVLRFRASNPADWNAMRAFDEGHMALFDYLGMRVHGTGQTSEEYRISMLPFLAYHRIWDTFYRNKQITKTIFGVNPNATNSALNRKNVSLVHHSFYSDGDELLSPTFDLSVDVCTFPDNTPIFMMRQRNYARDYFTAATPSPQQGNASKLQFDVTSQSGEFTISALRAANSLQKFLETNNLSQDYAEMMRNRWGTRPIDADFEEPYYLGRVIVPVYQKSVYQQDNSQGDDSKNPFVQSGTLGSRAGSAGFSGSGTITKKFHNTTWSYVMCLFSLVPHAMYGEGINRELLMTELGDFPAPEFQSVGYEEIKQIELYFDSSLDRQNNTFGYIPRYSRFKYMDDEVHGALRQGDNLEAFVLQRGLGTNPQLSTAFLEISKFDLDPVLSVTSNVMSLTCWYEIYFDFKVVMPLSDFCIPTLGDIQDTHTIKTSIGGSRL